MERDSQIIDIDQYTEEQTRYTLSNTQRGLIYTALSFTIVTYVLNMLGLNPSWNIAGVDIVNILLQGLEIGVGIVLILAFWFPYMKFHDLPGTATFSIALLCLTGFSRIINFATMSVDGYSSMYSMYGLLNVGSSLLYMIWYVILLTNDSKKYHDYKKIKTYAGIAFGSLIVPTIFMWFFSSLFSLGSYMYYIPLSIVHLIPTVYLFYIVSKIPSKSTPEL